MNFTAAVIVITLPIVAMMALFLLLNISAPATDDVRAMNYVDPDRSAHNRSGDRGADSTKPADQERRRAFQDRPGALRGGGESRRSHAARSEGSTQKCDGQKSGVDSADRVWRKSASSNSRHSPQPGPGSGPTSSRRKATSAISKANSSPPTRRKRRPERRSSRPKPTCAMRNSTSKAASTLLPPTVAWPIFPCNPACARPSSRQCP